MPHDSAGTANAEEEADSNCEDDDLQVSLLKAMDDPKICEEAKNLAREEFQRKQSLMRRGFHHVEVRVQKGEKMKGELKRSLMHRNEDVSFSLSVDRNALQSDVIGIIARRFDVSQTEVTVTDAKTKEVWDGSGPDIWVKRIRKVVVDKEGRSLEVIMWPWT